MCGGDAALCQPTLTTCSCQTETGVYEIFTLKFSRKYILSDTFTPRRISRNSASATILTVVGIFLVAGLGEDVVLDALLAERVHAVETLGLAVVLEADLAHEELVVQFLRQADAVPAARQHSEVLPLVVVVVVVAAVNGVGRRG